MSGTAALCRAITLWIDRNEASPCESKRRTETIIFLDSRCIWIWRMVSLPAPQRTFSAMRRACTSDRTNALRCGFLDVLPLRPNGILLNGPIWSRGLPVSLLNWRVCTHIWSSVTMPVKGHTPHSCPSRTTGGSRHLPMPQRWTRPVPTHTALGLTGSHQNRHAGVHVWPGHGPGSTPPERRQRESTSRGPLDGGIAGDVVGLS